MLSKTLATASILFLSLQTVTALPATPPTIGAPKGVIVVSNHATKREPIVIGSASVKIAPPHHKREADADAEADALPGGNAWGGR